MAERSFRGGGRHRGGRGRGSFRGGRGGRGNVPWHRQEGYNDAVASSVDEADVGIRSFVSDVKGFNGLVKQRFSDFIVREVPIERTPIARLTELELPVQPKKNRSVHTMLYDAIESYLGISCEKSTSWKAKKENTNGEKASSEMQGIFDVLTKRLVEKFVANGQEGQLFAMKKDIKDFAAKIAECVGEEDAELLKSFLDQLVAAKSDEEKHDLVFYFQPIHVRELRTTIHTIIREYGRLVVADTTADTSGQNTVIRLRPTLKKGKRKDMDDRGSRRDSNWPHNRPDYVKFVLYKKNKETVDAMQHIGKILRLNDKLFSYAGTKDKRGLTTQWVTGYRISRETIATINQSKQYQKNYDQYPFLVGNFSYVKEPLTLGDLYGNQFGIVIRNIPNEITDQEISNAVNSWVTHGFVNYFGLQRFGTKSIPSHIVGRAFLRKDFKLVADLILGPKEGDASKIKEARVHFQQYKDVEAALRMFPPFLVAENAVLDGFSRFGIESYERAVRNIPVKLRMIYTHAYQSYVWNEAASYRLSHYSSTKPVVGDMVLRGAIEVDPEAEVEETKDENPAKKRRRIMESDIIFITEDNINEYSIEDVVLPVHGYTTYLPKNTVASIYERCTSQDGVDFKSLRRDQAPEFNLPGSYRNIIRKPEGARHEVKRYNDETIPLMQSEVDIMLNRPPVPSIPDGAYRAICLEFILRIDMTNIFCTDFNVESSSYATMAIRELLKQNSSIHVQLQLNDQAKPKSIPIGRPGFSLGKN
ncbi:tRNA pseudouridine synthase D (TruD) [Thraustotheca clavata]|uniref:tRNA pseudouridine synthase D (TruD) n=1 Tax=Thraustotheca clavata TaxID=74557 RepID=A0A1W0A5A9_9STRA|nr:tRNA pseudouridine synthase D (TruD) [Thraustotheca clavata]